MAPAVVMRLALSEAIDPLLTLSALWHGPGDPGVRFAGRTVLRATRTSTGAAGLRLEVGRGEVTVRAWGGGASEALAGVPGLLGADDDAALFAPRHRPLVGLWRRFGGLRMTRTGAVFEALLPTIIAQKVTGLEAGRSYRALTRLWGEPAPGPLAAHGLRVPPAPALLARQPYHAFHRLGIERRRAETIIAAARAAERLEDLVATTPSRARHRLLALPGVGPWTAAETVRLALGDPDAVSVGDYNLPHVVCWALAGEARGSDARMLELLQPYAGQRARAVRLLELAGVMPPRFGPRLAPRSIADI